MTTTLVTGASGQIGTTLVDLLSAQGQTVRRATSQVPTQSDQVHLDLVRGSGLAAALDGVDRAFLLAPPGHTNQHELLGPVIAAARERGLRRVVLMSAMGANADDSAPLRRAELQLERSGLPWNVIRPNWFMQNFHTFWLHGILTQGRILLPVGQAKGSFIDARDIADSAAAALTTDRFDGKAFNLTGPEALGYAEAAALISEAIGKPVAYQAVDDDTFVGILVGAGVPQVYARFLASIFYPVREGWTAVVTDDVRTLTGHPARQVAAWVEENTAILKG